MEKQIRMTHVGQTVSVAHALEVASMFAAGRDENNRESLQHLRVRRLCIEGTNGHILIQLPIHEQPWLSGYRFVAADAALIMAKSTDDCQAILPTLPEEIEAFPDTDKTVKVIRENPVKFECLLSPTYLEVIGKSFGMLGIKKIRMRCREGLKAIEFIGETLDGPVGVAFQMPMK